MRQASDDSDDHDFDECDVDEIMNDDPHRGLSHRNIAKLEFDVLPKAMSYMDMDSK